MIKKRTKAPVRPPEVEIGSGHTFKTPQDSIRELLNDHFGKDVEIIGFRFDIKTNDGEARVEWWGNQGEAQ